MERERAVLLPHLRGRLRDHGHGRRRAGGAGAGRRRAPGVAGLHVLEGSRPGGVAPPRRPGSTARACVGASVGWDDVLDDLAAVLRDTIDGPGRRRGRRCTSPPGWPTTRPGRSRPASFLGALGSSSFYSGGHRRQRAGARRRRARHRQRDDEPALGPDAPRDCSSSSAPTPSCPTATARRCPTRSTTSATTVAAAGASGWSIRGAPRARRWPTSTSRSGPGPTSSCSPHWRVRCSTAAPTTDELRDYCAAEDVDALRRRARAVHGRPGRGRRRRRRRRAARRWSTTCARTADGWRSSCGTGRDDGDRRHPRRVAALGAADRPGSLDRPGGMRFPRGALNHLRPPRAARPTSAPGPASRRSCPGSPARSRRSRWPTRSRPATSGRSS